MSHFSERYGCAETGASFRALLVLVVSVVAWGWGVPVGHGASEGSGFTSSTAPLAERFARPPAEARIIKIIHGWPDDARQQDRWREGLLRQGFGGVVCNVSFQEYLESDARWESFLRAVKEARKDGMTLWLYDEKGYPSGNAGGLVLRDHADWEAEGLLIADAECGPGPITLDVPPGRSVMAVALPIAPTVEGTAGGTLAPDPEGVEAGGEQRLEPIDLPAPVDGRLTWNAPGGRWQVLIVTHAPLYAGTHAEMNLAEKTPYINLLRPEPTRRFIEVTYARYAQRFGEDLGRWFFASFTDEPSLMSMFFRRMPYRPLPWAPELPAEFRKRRGYELPPVVPDLVLARAGAQAPRHRHDFWLTVGELVSANFFGQIQDACREHQLPSGGHLLAEESIVNHVPLYGDFFRCLRRLDAPSIDCLTSLPAEVPWYVARLAASAAELDQRRTVMCETSDHSQVWRPAGDSRPKRLVTEAEIRGTCNRLMVAGVNVITSYYSFAGLADDALRRLNEWVGRCTTLLTGGHQVADIAVVYPIESLWTRFIPAAHWAGASPEANRIGSLFRTAGDALFESRRDFTIIDSRTLAEATVEGEALVHGSLRWRVVVLPGVDTLPLAAWQNLERFARSGGLVIGLGATPANSEREFPGAGVIELGRRLFGTGVESRVQTVGKGSGVYLPAGTEALLPGILDRALEPQVTLSPSAPSVRMTHRRVADRDVYFFVQDSAAPWRGEISVVGSGEARIWNPADGTHHAVAAGGRIPIDLDSYGATFLTVDHAPVARRISLAPGVVPGLTLRALTTTNVLESHGEFVKAEVGLDVERASASRAVWRARATLTRDKVDTYLFVRLPVARSEELGGAELVEIETWVPEGQRTAAQLLVMLHEEGGGDFLAETSRALGVAGHESTYIPMNRFQLAGWSKDADGVLDRSRVTEVRIGWGGYYGSEGERVEFSFAPPRLGSAE